MLLGADGGVPKQMAYSSLILSYLALSTLILSYLALSSLILPYLISLSVLQNSTNQQSART